MLKGGIQKWLQRNTSGKAETSSSADKNMSSMSNMSNINNNGNNNGDNNNLLWKISGMLAGKDRFLSWI